MIDKRNNAASDSNIVGLEEEIEAVKTDAKTEEIFNAETNYEILKDLKEDAVAKLPYPDVGPYDTDPDYNERDRLIIAKRENRKYWDEEDRIDRYYQNGSLYCGHLKTIDADFYITEKPTLDSCLFSYNKRTFNIINADDRRYEYAIRQWRFPDRVKDVTYSRNITMKDKSITDVDVVIDRESQQFTYINDSFLRNVLIRNKRNGNIQSIIQTIQEKQNQIRSLNKDLSIIVHGCAGSGKTMVLLHRIRYLLFNKDIDQDNYVFLVPGFKFKRYLETITSQFNIKSDNVIPLAEYYRVCAGNKLRKDVEDQNELVFGSNFLSRVYSTEFLSDCYRVLFESFFNQIDRLIEKSETILHNLTLNETAAIDKKIADIQLLAIKSINERLKPFKKIVLCVLSSFEEIGICLDELNKAYQSQWELSQSQLAKVEQTSDIPDDDQLLNDSLLINIKKEIEAEKKQLENASVFTVDSHQKKLSQLQKRYDEAYDRIKQKLFEESKKAVTTQKTESSEFCGMPFSKANSLILSIIEEYESLKKSLQTEKENKQHINEHIYEKYKEEIDSLNHLINASADIKSASDEFIEKLMPSYDFFVKYINIGKKLYNAFSRHIKDNKAIEYFRTEFIFFSSTRTENQLKAYLYSIVLNACKKQLRTEFDYSLCDIYKHYWFLVLYFRFLTYGYVPNPPKYVFIDESQDLSLTEFDLIYKICTKSSDGNIVYPVINAFGDINQTVSSHSIHNWEEISFSTQMHILDENFRNPNQITRFCNDLFDFKMKEIGVDLDEVSLYKDLQEMLNCSHRSFDGSTFIVKDEYRKKDLQQLIWKQDFIECQILTVKESKGFEFKEVFVVDMDMTDNEKYISYTRALIKLHIISSIPEFADRSESLIVQGDEDSAGKQIDYDYTEVLDHSRFPSLDLIPADLREFAEKIIITGKRAGKYYLIPYTGKLRQIIGKDTVQRFVPQYNDKQKERLVRVSLVEDENLIFIDKVIFEAYKDGLINGKYLELRKTYSS